MSSLFNNVSKGKFVLLELGMLMPTAIYAGIMYEIGMPVLALLVYLLFCTILVPVSYIIFVLGKLSTETIQLLGTFANIKLSWKDHLKSGFLGFFIGGALMATILWVSLSYLKIWKLDNINLLWEPDVEIVILSVLMIVLHPFLEEFYWRLFIQTAFVGGITYEHPSEFVCWWIAFHYGLMHVFIVANFTNSILHAFAFAVPFIILGRVLTYMRHGGLLPCLLTHTGVNIGIVAVLNYWYWNNVPI